MFLGSFVLLLTVQAVTYWGMLKMNEAKAQANRSHNVNARLEVLLSEIKDIETSIRGYALTGDAEFLQPYHTAFPKIEADLRYLEKTILDPEQTQNLPKLRELANERVLIAQNVIKIQDTEGMDPARKAIEEGLGRRAMDALRAHVDMMLARETALAQESENRATSATNFSRTLFVMGFILVLAMQGLAFYAILKEVNQRRQAEESVSQLNSQLEAHVKELDNEILERKKAEEHIQNLNAQLQNQLEIQNETNNTLQAVNKELESFAYSVSHDLRSPLRGLDGLSLALLEDYGDKIDSVGKSFLERMRSESQRMGQLIDGILSLSRLTRGEIHKEPVNLSEVANEIINQLKQEEPERDVITEVENGLEVNADPRLIEAVLQNLLSNAWKFTSKHPTAHIKFGSEMQDDRKVYFVKDDGAGFDMAYIDKMFGAFQRLHGVRDFPGTGIGLATVQRIIHRHGGTIWAEGAPEQGATFYFTLA